MLSAYLTLTPESALEEAAAAEKEIRAGDYRGPLHGIPVAIKDNLATCGVRTTAGAKALSGWIPDFDATVVTRLREAGAVSLGKTQMHEWAKGSHGVNPFYGTPRNPWNTGADSRRLQQRLGSGRGRGSCAWRRSAPMPPVRCAIRRRCAAIVGLKPTYGRVSVFGGVPGTGGYSTNHFGPLTRSVADCAAMMQVIAGHDPQDPLSSTAPVPDYAAGLGRSVEGMRVGIIDGILREVRFRRGQAGVRRSARHATRSLGMTVEEVTVPHMDLIPAVQLCASRVESTGDAEYYLRHHARDYSPSMLSTQIQALTVSGLDYNQSQRIRRLICDGFDEALEEVDVIVAPTGPVPAISMDDSQAGYVTVDGRKMPLQGAYGNFLTLCTIPFNVNGLPSLSINCSFSNDGLPIGVQIAGGSFREDTVMQVAHAYEQASPATGQAPPLP